MSNTRYSQPMTTQRYTHSYGVFRGVDFVDNPVNCEETRSPWALNIMPDAAGYPSKRPGWTSLDKPSAETPPQINGIFYFAPANEPTHARWLVVHAGSHLYMYAIDDDGEPNLVYNNVEYTLHNGYSTAFQHKNKLYILDEEHYVALFYDDGQNKYVCKDVSTFATAPITQDCGYYEAIPQGTDPETYEYKWHWGELTKPNLLTARRVNTFAGDDVNKVFWLDAAHCLVEKVETFAAQTAPGTSSSYAKITAAGTTNIRNAPSQSNSQVIGYAQQGQQFPYYSTVGTKWYKISYNGQVAYVHTSRATIVTSTGEATTESVEADWSELASSAYTVAEDTTKNRTKITFTSAPAAHPDGAGLPSIRVTFVVTETDKLTTTGEAYNEDYIHIPLAVSILSVKVNGSSVTYTFSPDDNGEIIISSAVADDATIEVEYLRGESRNVGVIEKCRFYGTFGAYNNDVFFFSGNREHPNRDWASESDDPTLFREDSWTDIGAESNPIMGYVTYQSAQIIVKASHDDSGAIYRRTSQTIADGDVIFPVKQSFAGSGAVSEHAFAQLRDAPLYLTANGVYGFISSDLASRYSVQEKSYLIKTKLLQEQLPTGVAVEWHNMYLLAFPGNGHCYVADGGQQTAPSNTERPGYEWYYWENIPARCFCVVDGYLFFGTESGWVCRFYEGQYYDSLNNEITPISAVWATSASQLYSQSRVKYIERRGCIFHLSHDATSFKLAVITDAQRLQADRETEIVPFDDLQEYDIIDLQGTISSPHYCLNKPIKRFDYVQFVIRNDNVGEGLGVYALEYQYRYGRYMK